MPTTLASFLIILLAIFPGALADKLYRMIMGVNWREKEWQIIIRLLGFSLSGIILYSVIAYYLGWPQPIYIFPSNYNADVLKPESLPLIFIPYGGHFLSATLIGLLSAVAMRFLGRWVPTYTGAWEDFIRLSVPEHWVVVTLNSGEVYAGILQSADTSVKQDERDLVLLEPALYRKKEGKYVASSYHSMFLPAKIVYSIAAVYNPETDTERVSAVRQQLFTGGDPEDELEPLLQESSGDSTKANSIRPITKVPTCRPFVLRAAEFGIAGGLILCLLKRSRRKERRHHQLRDSPAKVATSRGQLLGRRKTHA
jgi:hypothetical protein